MDIAPELNPFVGPKDILNLTVAQALHSNAWVGNIQGSRTVAATVQFVQLWLAVQRTSLHADHEDLFRWTASIVGPQSRHSTRIVG
jgi:hypothetical protein